MNIYEAKCAEALATRRAELAAKPKPFTGWHADTIYLGDNGRALCGDHLGMSAKYTGRDLSGQTIMAVTPAIAAMPESEGLCCEHCLKEPYEAEFFAKRLATMTDAQILATLVPAPRTRGVRAIVKD